MTPRATSRLTPLSFVSKRFLFLLGCWHRVPCIRDTGDWSYCFLIFCVCRYTQELGISGSGQPHLLGVSGWLCLFSKYHPLSLSVFFFSSQKRSPVVFGNIIRMSTIGRPLSLFTTQIILHCILSVSLLFIFLSLQVSGYRKNHTKGRERKTSGS